MYIKVILLNEERQRIKWPNFIPKQRKKVHKIKYIFFSLY